VAVETFHCLAGCQAQNKVGVGAQFAGDDAGDQGGGGFLIWLYDNFHRNDPATGEGKKTLLKCSARPGDQQQMPPTQA